ncbi:conserved hypothetical protein [delta proteobacterium NaphS2]|nr:conserved hypothetical protein [delta proteobacterium NaphS2]
MPAGAFPGKILEKEVIGPLAPQQSNEWQSSLFVEGPIILINS